MRAAKLNVINKDDTGGHGQRRPER